MKCSALSLLSFSLLAAAAANKRPSFRSLPTETIFPGPWEEYIGAPSNRTHVRANRVLFTEGNVVNAQALLEGRDLALGPLQIGAGGMVVLDFGANIAGRVYFNISIRPQSSSSLKKKPVIALSYSESPAYVGREPDATTDRQARDLPLFHVISRNGVDDVGKDFIRGGFRYLTLWVPSESSQSESLSDKLSSALGNAYSAVRNYAQHHFGITGGDQSPIIPGPGDLPVISVQDLWVNFTAFPSNKNLKAYTGYFYSSSNLLNRIWYAGAYTLQLSTLDPSQGGALIDYNRLIDHNDSPTGSWYSNFSISYGTTVTTDGAKRDRMVWPGDMTIAAPGIAVSTYDMASVRNALDILFYNQYAGGELPYAGPPMGYRGEFSDTYHMHSLLGVWNYIMYTNDLVWLYEKWPQYLKAIELSFTKVDLTGLFHVTSTADWLRPGMSGHNLEATSLLYAVIHKSLHLARLLNDKDGLRDARWLAMAARLERGIEFLYCEKDGMYGDNIGRRGCGGVEEVLPQDGNSWAIISGVVNPRLASNVSTNLRSRWIKHGAPCPEFPNVISPFASSFELLAHAAAGNHDHAVELMEHMWGYMLDGAGFTNSTLAEGYRVDGFHGYPAYWSPARNSHAHGWSSGPTTVLMHDILGIKLVEPLGKEWKVEPHLTKWLTYAKGGFATELGKFEVTICRVTPDEAEEVEVLRLNTPDESTGTLTWGDASVKFEQGGQRNWLRVLKDGNGKYYANGMGGGRWVTMAKEEESTWELLCEQSKINGEKVRPATEERPVGVVDWEKLLETYIRVSGIENIPPELLQDVRQEL